MAGNGWRLITFGAGLPNWRAAARRLANQAQSTGWFADIQVYDERRLATDFPYFARVHGALMRANRRGYGYWIWKPFLISRNLRSARRAGLEGVLYLDAGFEVNSRSSAAAPRLREYMTMAHESGGVFAMHLPGHKESEWTRRTVMDRLDLPSSLRATSQVQATPFFSCTSSGEDFAEDWLGRCVEDDYSLLLDPKPGEAQSLEFREHRHDQSIFSCLIKLGDIPTWPDETFWAPDWFRSGADFPLWAARNRTRVRLGDESIAGKTTRIIEKTYSRSFAELASRLTARRRIHRFSGCDH